MSDEELVQLDLTLGVTVVPQANNLELFIALIDELLRGCDTSGELAARLAVEERTVHYYIDFGRWLRLLDVTGGTVQFTELGRGFAESVASRGRIFAQAMFARTLVKAVQVLKRDSVNDDHLPTVDTRTACVKAIRAMTDLSDSTVERRAGGLAVMLEAAYKPSSVDWSTGRLIEDARRALEYEGRSFGTALGARQFTQVREFRVGWPKQVRLFVENGGRGLSAKVWSRASWSSADGNAVWFGAVPVNESTVEVAARGGRDLRRFLLQVVPYVALTIGLLTYRDRAGRHAATLTHDMYGVRLWASGHDVGSPLSLLERVAEALELVPTKALPIELQKAPPSEIESGDMDDLLEVLLLSGFVRRDDTSYVLAPGIDAELREARDDGGSALTMLRPVWTALDETLRQ